VFFAVNSSNKLYKKARQYRDFGWSVIPVRGSRSPGNPKAPAVRWSEFQGRLATDSELAEWFIRRRVGGLAVVCGRVSQLAVLDFDDESLAARFVAAHPHLARTRIVRSGGRGLPHFYFHVPANLHTRSRHLRGVDWQFDGTYVVAPPTSLDGGRWRVESDTSPKTLSEGDLAAIDAFLDSSDLSDVSMPFTALSVRSSVGTVGAERSVIDYYRERVGRGRNNALFATCRWLRDRGQPVEAATPLIEVHVHQPPRDGVEQESPAQRRDEAIATIASAFSRRPVPQDEQPLTVIPNQLRERLLQADLTAVLRVLEVISEQGWKPGQTFTRPELLQACQSKGVGDWSLRKALSATLSGGDCFFPLVANAANAAVLDGVNTPQLNAIELRVSAPTEKAHSGRGRPPTLYVVPSLRALCKHYGVTSHAGDALDSDVLSSVRDYRAALHRALLARRPGSYHREWLADRLGVSVRTLCRYNTDDGIHVAPRYIDRRVLWSNLTEVMPSDLQDPTISHFGAFLEDETGKRYPPFVSIARRLLRQRRQVLYRRRTRNHYSVGSVPAIHQMASETMDSQQPSLRHRQLPRGASPPVGQPPPPPPIAPPGTASDAADRQLTPADETVVSQLLDALGGTMSRTRAEQLVLLYGRYAVTDVLQVLTERGTAVRHPAGFVVRLLHARYGSDGDAATTAEGLFLALQRDGRALLSWSRARALVREYGPTAVSEALRSLRADKQVRRPVGYVVRALERGGRPSDTHDADALIAGLRDCELSGANARRLLKAHGAERVAEALKVLRQRERVANPAGFVIAFLRSEKSPRRAG
jgi:hypothetical protein